MRRQIRSFLPDHEAIRANRWLSPFADTLLHPRLWDLNRHSAAGAVAVGMFCGLVPGPLQVLSATICAVIFRVNLPLAMITTVYTNPFTIVPLYVVAYAIGQWVWPGPSGGFVQPPEWGDEGFLVWVGALIDWMLGLGAPLAVGLVLLASLLAAAGYLLVRVAWRIYLVRAWRRRGERRRAVRSPPDA